MSMRVHLQRHTPRCGAWMLSGGGTGWRGRRGWRGWRSRSGHYGWRHHGRLYHGRRRRPSCRGMLLSDLGPLLEACKCRSWKFAAHARRLEQHVLSYAAVRSVPKEIAPCRK
eukprot:scaffold10988_cov62-Phaeocystis_antarctica.AAC.4